MDDIDRIVEELLQSKRIRESATFSSRSYADQPIIQTGRQFRESQANRPPKAPRPHPEGKGQPGGQGQLFPHGEARLGGTRSLGGRPGPSDANTAGPERPKPIPETPASPGPYTPPTWSNPRPVTHENSPIPYRYHELRELAQRQGNLTTTNSFQGLLAYGSRSANRLFYEQARFMEDFEDDYDFSGSFFQYYPTYSSMSLTQLRGYFSWRTQVRRGNLQPAPTSFAFLYVYELLCGIGTTPGEQGYQDLKAFREGYRELASSPTSSFISYTLLWLKDYVVYHGLDPALARRALGEVPTAVTTLLRAEAAALRDIGLERRLEASWPMAGGTPTDEELFSALDVCSSYHASGSRLRHDHLDDLRSVTCQVFRGLCVHCRRRRKTDYVEGLFGEPVDEPRTMFSSAVFYDPEPHPDTVFVVSPAESFSCKDGRWRHHFVCRYPDTSQELGKLLRATDGRLRTALEFPYPLKARATQAYVAKIIDTAIAEHLERKRQEEARHIDIDLSRLAGIRAAAAMTQEALLTEEERGEQERPQQAVVEDTHAMPVLDVPDGTEPGIRPDAAPDLARPEIRIDVTGSDTQSDTALVFREQGQDTLPGTAPKPMGSARQPETSLELAGQDEQPSTALDLTELETRVLVGLLTGDAPALGPTDPPLSLLVDAINEKLFGLVGDTIVEYVSDEPAIIEDYRPDVKEALGL